MMETYANNLEAIVDDRTKQVIGKSPHIYFMRASYKHHNSDEKRKTDELLYEMLPKYVAEQLKQGKKVMGLVMFMFMFMFMFISKVMGMVRLVFR